MATGPNSKSTRKIEHTEAEILKGSPTQRPGDWQPVHCPNPSAHKHGDRNPSGSYNLATGFYRCFGCGLMGYAKDRNRPDWEARQTRAYSNGTKVYRDYSDGAKRFWQSSGSKADDPPKPYNHETLHSGVQGVYIVEGEKCADALVEHLDPRTEAVLTSKQGATSAEKTDWSPVLDAIERRCEIVFLPDCDLAGDSYIRTVAEILGLEKINVIRLGRENGYDIADWLDQGKTRDTLPEPTVEDRVLSTTEGKDYRGLFGHHEPEELRWLAEDMIPAGKLTLLFGRAKIGKSTMAMHIASMVSQQKQPFAERPLPSFRPVLGKPHRVLVYSSEDDWNDAIAVRLKLMNADMRNIAPLRSQYDPRLSFDWSAQQRGDNRPTDFEVLLHILREEPVSLLVIDPLIDIITGGNNNDAATIRRAIEERLLPIMSLGVTVVGVHHERKGARPDDLLLDRALGSQAWPAVARSVLYMQALPKRIALGVGTNPQPRGSADRKYNVTMRDLGTNSSLMGVVTVTDSNYAAVDGGYHYELPTLIPDGQSSSFISIAVHPKKIAEQTPNALVEVYNPLGKPPESAINRKARIDMNKDTLKVNAATKAVREAFEGNLVDEKGRIDAITLREHVKEVAQVGDRNAKEAIGEVTESVREGKTYFRLLKDEK